MRIFKITITALIASALITGLGFMFRIYFSSTTSHINRYGGSCVVLIHGLFRGPESMEDIAAALKDRGYSVINFGYSTRSESIESVADRLYKTIEKNAGAEIKSISFVTHSLGSLVGRYFLTRYRIDRLKRMVMIAPPNRGSVWGRILENNLPFMQSLIGSSGDMIKNGISGDRMIPDCEFGIIAGGTGDSSGYNPLIPGDDDMTVGVSETRLKGMKDFILVKGQHSALLRKKIVIDNVLSFLDKGHFMSERERELAK